LAIGRHLLADFYCCEADFLNDPARIEGDLTSASTTAGADLLRTCFYRFHPQGVSGMVLISESHLAVHTYPEHAYAALDFFTCGRVTDPRTICELLVASFRPKVVATECLVRGQHLAEDCHK